MTETERVGRTWRPVEENAARRSDLEAVEHFGVEEREDDHLLQGVDVLAHPSHAVKRHL